MRSDSYRHKFWHTIIGFIGIAAIVCSGFLTASTQRAYSDAFNKLSSSVQVLADAAQTDRSLSVDQVLGAAAAKLIQQDKEIGQLNRDMHGVTHPLNGLYIRDMMVAAAEGNATLSGNLITFQLVVTGQDGLDFDQTYRFQDADLKCQKPGTYGQVGTFGVMRMQYPGMVCTIVGRHH